jgi:hypothetical protein
MNQLARLLTNDETGRYLQEINNPVDCKSVPTLHCHKVNQQTEIFHFGQQQ